MGRQGHDTAAPAPGMRIQRSQSKMSLSASFEALAVYFPCMNSFDEEDGELIFEGNDPFLAFSQFGQLLVDCCFRLAR
ncbi:unnamed protein product [Pleuronectes platessa]|uniref:Uncharacterized protein n=1 Tax=Pleuronectes platessa TaxID=8262 RepID=A0A9N7V1D4_PLEPL|nr:unnamed protein product [Pleuronectes platessa]